MKKKILFSRFSVDMLDSIVASYNFNTNLIDEVNANNATNFGGTFVTGKIGEAIKYEPSQYSVIPHSTNLNFTDGVNDLDFSIFLRFKLNIASPTVFQSMILSKGLNEEWRINMRANDIQLYLFTNGLNYVIYSFRDLGVNPGNPSGIYKDYVFTHSNGVAKLFINGVEYIGGIATTGSYTGMPILSNTLQISKLGTLTSLYAAIDLDSMAIWKNRALGINEAKRIYKNNIGREYPF
jgi:hypothetical protein